MEVQEFNVKLKDLYSRYEEVRKQGDYQTALATGVEILGELIEFTKSNILCLFANPIVKEVATEILIEYERGLSFVRGACEAARSAPLLYAPGLAERAMEVLDAFINGLFNFAMGALLVVAELSSYA